MKHAYLATAFGCLLALGTPAVAQTLDIRSFGARCDGGDDSGAINAAFGALPNGGTLLLNCTLGTSGVLLHSKQGVTVDGAGGRLIGLFNNPAKILFRVEACSGCSIRNFTIDTNNVGAAGVSLYWSNNSSIENTTVTNVRYPAYAGIVGMGNQGNRYLNNTVSGTTAGGGEAPRGIWMGNPDSPLLERNPTISGNNIRDIAATGLVLHTVGATITGNTIERAQGAGMKLAPPPGQGGQTNIRQNTLRNNLWHGIQLAGVDSPVYIQNNTIANNGNTGIVSSAGGFVNSQVSGNSISGNGQAALYIYDARNTSIQGNQISGNGNGLIFEAVSSSSMGGIQVSGNTISDSKEDGIIVRGRGGSLSGLGVSSNSIMNNRRYGMSVEESSTGTVSVSLNGNCFSGNSAGALFDSRVVNVIGGIFNTSGCSSTVSAPAPTQVTAPAPSNTTNTPSAPAPTSQPSGALPIRINAGGGQYTAPNGEVWAGDYGFAGGRVYDSGRSIANTSMQELYRTHHWIEGTLEYNIPAPSGTRTVILKFAETYVSGPGQRIFDVYINGQLVLPGFDIAAVAGINVAHDRSFPVQSNGSISIRLVGRAQNPMISGIEIR